MPLHPNATQCAYTKVDGRRCGGPAVTDSLFCHHHDGLKRRFQDRQYMVPALDDQNAVQVALMDVINGLLTKSINRADANSIIQALWLAKSNLKGLTLSPVPPDELEALLQKTRDEGHSAGYNEASEKARITLDRELRQLQDRHAREIRRLEERHQKELERREQEEANKGESLASILLAELARGRDAAPADDPNGGR